MEEKSLIIQNLNGYYGKSHVLQDVSISVQPGERVAILGRNGMGKSTLLKAILGIGGVKRAGDIQYGGAQMINKATSDIARSGIGYVPQGWQLFRSLTTEEHLIMAYRRSKKGFDWTPEAVFEFFPELARRKKTSGTSLSGGEQQLLAIGRALVTNSDLFLMDEPSEGISTMVLDRIIGLCNKLTEDGKSILLVEQNLELAMNIGQKVYILVNGQIVLETTSEAFRNDREKHRLYLGI